MSMINVIKRVKNPNKKAPHSGALHLCLGVIDGDQVIYLFQHPFIHDLIQHPLASLFVIYLHLLRLLCFANCCAHVIFPSPRRQCNWQNSSIRLLFCSMMLQIIACGFCVLQKRPFFRVFCPSFLFVVFYRMSILSIVLSHFIWYNIIVVKIHILFH